MLAECSPAEPAQQAAEQHQHDTEIINGDSRLDHRARYPRDGKGGYHRQPIRHHYHLDRSRVFGTYFLRVDACALDDLVFGKEAPDPDRPEQKRVWQHEYERTHRHLPLIWFSRVDMNY